MLRVVFATGNDNKVRELQQLLGEQVSLSKSNYQPQVDEYGASCAANAVIKAQCYFAAQEDPASFDYLVSDDSGIFVPYLGDNIPGVRSARFSNYEILNAKLVEKNSADFDQIDVSNNQLLLKYMEGAADENRTAYFYAALAVLDNQGKFIDLFEGISFGKLTHEIHDNDGWGYDHVFVSDSGNYWGKVKPVVKNTESHRYKACKLLAEFLERN